MKWIGLTGGIACGKSTVSRKLVERSIPIIDADEVAKWVVRPGSPGLKSIQQEFGNEILLPDGSLDRRKLGQRVFGHPEQLQRLEAITHPLIRAEVLLRRQKLEAAQCPFVIYDVPLLFETKSEKQFDAIIVVTCGEQQQRERLRRRNQLTEAEIDARLSSQMPLRFKEQHADFVIENNQDEEHLMREIDRLTSWLSEKKSI